MTNDDETIDDETAPTAAPGDDETAIAFVGTGTMGRPMALQVLAAGFSLRVHDAVAAATAPLAEAGATVCASAAEAAAGARIVLLSLPGPEQVVDAVTGPDGVLAASDVPAFVVDLSTNSVDAVRLLGARCAERGAVFVDAPVSGGVAKARDGSLSVMVGAGRDAFDAVQPVLAAIGGDVIHVGPPGSGTIAKLVNNQLFLAAGVLVQEAYVLGHALGMAPDDLHRIIGASSAGPYAKLAPLLLGRRFDDVIFRLDIAAKDVGLAVETATAAGVDAPMTRAALDVYRGAVDAGDGDLVFHATLRELERRADVELDILRRPPRPDAAPGATAS